MRRLVIAAFATFISWIVLAGAVVQADIRSVVLTGDAAPHTTAGERFHAFENVQFNNRGEVGFFGHLADAAGTPIYIHGDDPNFDLTPDVGIWVLGSNDSRLIVRQGRQAPASPPNSPVWLIDPKDSDDRRYDFRLSSAGVLLQALSGARGDDATLWLVPTAGEAMHIASSRQPVPGSDLRFSGLTPIALSDSGYALFEATHAQSGIYGADAAAYARWRVSPGSELTPIMQTLMPAVGVPPPAVFDSIFYYGSAMNEQGDVVFANEIAPSPQQSSINQRSGGDPSGLWVGRHSGDLALLALHTDDDGSGSTLSSFDSPQINSRGDVVARSRNGYGASLFRNGEHRLLARGDQPAPGATDTVFTAIYSVELSKSGKVAIAARLWNPQTEQYVGDGIWVDAGTGLEPVMLPGDVTPIGDGSTFGALVSSPAAIIAAGQVLFVANFRRGTEDWRPGVFAQDRRGELRSIVAVGDALEVAPGDVRTVVGGIYTANLNDRGEVLFTAYFADGTSGIFISDVVAVPEPDAALLLLTFAAAALSMFIVERRPRSSAFVPTTNL